MKLIRATLLLIALGTLTGFGACTSNPQTPPTTTTATAPVFDLAKAQRDVYAAKEAYGVAERLATAYAKLPRCATPAVQPCSDQAVVDQITKARNIARDSLNAAQNAVDTPGFGSDIISTAVTAAQAAMSAFTSVANKGA